MSADCAECSKSCGECLDAKLSELIELVKKQNAFLQAIAQTNQATATAIQKVAECCVVNDGLSDASYMAVRKT